MDSTDQTELRLVGVSEDGQWLVLAEPGGAEHTVAIDERLRAAVNGHLSRLGQLTMALESRISPKEIQTRVRAGESAEHVALTAGVPLERVLRFVGPVLREREHVAEQARRARLVTVAAGSQGAPGTQAPGPASLLGDLVDRVTSRRGADAVDVNWDSARRDDHSWVITVSWPDGAVATWSLDLLRHQVTPLDGPARRISGVAAPKPDPTATAPDLDPFDEPAPESESTNVRAFTRRPQAVPDVPLAFDEPAEPSDPSDPAEASDTVPAGSEPSSPAAPAEPAAQTDAGRPVVPPVESPRGAPASGRPAPRSGKRASVPNWDDIVFGMKPKD